MIEVDDRVLGGLPRVSPINGDAPLPLEVPVLGKPEPGTIAATQNGTLGHFGNDS